MPLKVSAACTIVCLGSYGSRAPASPAPSHDTSFGYGRRVLRICMNMLKFVWRCFFCAVWLAGWRVLDAGAGLRELRVAGSGYRFVPTPVSGALVLDFYLANLQGTRAFCLISYLSLASLRPMTDIIGHARLALCVCVCVDVLDATFVLV
jgi:hypothetical protein